MIVAVKEGLAKTPASSTEPKHAGKLGQYVKVLNWLSLYG
jgi:hypothetical protein